MKPIPEETLRATYARESPYRPHWPESYERGMQDPLIRAIVETLARAQVPAFGRRKADRLAAGGIVARAPRQPELDVPKASTPEPVKRQWHGPHLAPGEIDRKRAASGDFDSTWPDTASDD